MSVAPTGEPRPRLRWLVAPGEGRALLAAAAAFFCLLCGYYMLRPLREAMALEVGREWNAALFAAALVVQLCILPPYWWLVARVSRRRIAATVYGVVVALFALLAVGLHYSAMGRAFAAVYFVAVTSLNLLVVSLFWSLMADLWEPQAAKRLFGFVAAGGSVGALVGPLLLPLLIRPGGPSLVIAGACGFLLGTIWLLDRARAAREHAPGVRELAQTDAGAVGGRAIDELLRLVSSRYLLAIVALVVIGQILGAFMYNEQARYVAGAWSGLEDRAVLFSRMELGVNLLALVLQSTVVGALTTRTSLRTSLAAMPALAALSFLLLALVPLGAMVLATNVLRRALEYGLAKPTREMLFTVLNSESKFKSKSLIDTVLQRGSDTLGQSLYLGAGGLGLAAIGWLSACACLGSVLLSRWLGGVFEARGGDQALSR